MSVRLETNCVLRLESNRVRTFKLPTELGGNKKEIYGVAAFMLDFYSGYESATKDGGEKWMKNENENENEKQKKNNNKKPDAIIVSQGKEHKLLSWGWGADVFGSSSSFQCY